MAPKLTTKAVKAARALLIERAATVIYDAFTYEYDTNSNPELMPALNAVSRYLTDRNQDAGPQMVCYDYFIQLTSGYQSIKQKATINMLYAEITMAAAEKIDAYLNQ